MAKRDYSKESGTSGTSIQYGHITGEEFNPKLTKTTRLKIFEEMRKSDATVRSSLNAMKMPIRQAKYNVDAVSDDDADKEVAKVVETCLFEFNDWPKVVSEILTYLDFGFSLFEMLFEPRDIDGRRYIALTKLAFRKQTSLYAWETEQHEQGVTQLVDGNYYSIPDYKLVPFTNDREGDNYEGVSMLRAAYRNWYFKDKLEKIDAMGHERQGLGVLDIVHPDGATDADKKKMATAARALRANSQSYIMRAEGWQVGFMDMKAKSMKDIAPSIAYHDRQISKNMQLQFIEIGSQGSSGTRNVSEDQGKMFELSVQAVAEYIAEVLTHRVIQTIVDLNFTNRACPKLSVEKIGDDNIPVISEAFAKFVTAGVLHPTADDENRVRKMIGLGEVGDDELKDVYEAAAGTGKDEKPKEASTLISQVKQLRASVEEALYADTQRAA